MDISNQNIQKNAKITIIFIKVDETFLKKKPNNKGFSAWSLVFSLWTDPMERTKFLVHEIHI